MCGELISSTYTINCISLQKVCCQKSVQRNQSVATLRMTRCCYFLAWDAVMIVLYALKGKSICHSNLQKQIMPVNQHGVDFDGTNHSSKETRAMNSLLQTLWLVLSGSHSLSLSPSLLFLLCQYTPRHASLACSPTLLEKHDH